jgi:hypothetical protein
MKIFTPAVQTVPSNSNHVRQLMPPVNKKSQQAAMTSQTIGSKNDRTAQPLFSSGDVKDHSSELHTENEHDDQTTSTKSVTQSTTTPSLLSTATSQRHYELEALFRSQQSEIADNSKLSKRTDSTLQHTISKGSSRKQ